MRQAVRMMLVTMLLLGSAVVGRCGDKEAGELPGVWVEFENGGWHTAAKEDEGASGGRKVSWFDRPDRSVYVVFTLEEKMKSTVLFLRYSRAGKTDGAIGIGFSAITDAVKPEQAPERARLRTRSTGGSEKYDWLSLPLDDLKPGKYVVVVRCLDESIGINLDVAGLVPDDRKHAWMPPNIVRDGKLVGEGQTLASKRPDDRLDEKKK